MSYGLLLLGPTHTNTGTYGKHAGNGNQYFSSEFCISIHLSLFSTSKASA